MVSLNEEKRELVMANRILANEGVLDAYGHVSARSQSDPSVFLLSRSRSPELVEPDDLMEIRLDGSVATGDDRPPYLERFIHGAIYEARPEFTCVIHGHTEALLPFGLTDSPLRPVIHSASDMGAVVPVWDIRDSFGDQTDLMVTRLEHGRDLATALGECNVVLMRGHGFTAGGKSVVNTVRMCIYLAVNARVLTTAESMGMVTELSPGEISARDSWSPDSPAVRRSWDYWAARAGV